MKHSSIFLVALFLIESLTFNAAAHRIIVCPVSEANETCKSLADLVFGKGKHFANNTNMVFLPGIHRLSGVLAIAGVSNFSLSCDQPQSDADVHCDGHSGLIFSRSKNITIKKINFLSCGANTSQKSFAALSFEQVAVLTIESIQVRNSIGYGVHATHISEQVIMQRCVFRDNEVHSRYLGGNARLSFQNCSDGATNLLLIQSTEFMNGSTTIHHASGLTVDCMCPGMTVYLVNVTASSNEGGNIQLRMRDYDEVHNWKISVTHSLITSGNGIRGSGLYFTSKLDRHYCDNASTMGFGNSITIVDTHFESNTARKFGGGFMAKLHDSDCKTTNITLINCTFSGNVVTDPNGHGAAIKVQKYSIPLFYRPLLPLYQIQLVNSHFWNNSIHGTEGSVIEFGNIEKATLEDCSFIDNIGTALAMTASDVIFTGNITFDNNTATKGGALRFCDSSAMFLNPRTAVIFKNNFARQVGGAIFAQEACLAEPKACFFQPVAKYNTLITDISTIALVFINNTAGVAGDAIYGGEVDYCYTYTKFRSNGGNLSYFLSSEVFNATFNLTGQGNGSVSSEPYKVEFCEAEADTATCKTKTNIDYVTAVPGKIFYICAVALGQRSGIAPAVITPSLACDNPNITITQTVHPILSKGCANLSLALRTTHAETTVELMLNVQRSNVNWNNDQYKRNLTVFITACPWGFTLNKIKRSCECLADRVSKYVCDLDTLTIYVTDYEHLKWIGCEKTLNHTDSDAGLVYANGCGHREYCNDQVSSIPARCTDSLCVDNRTGILCGSCVPGWSVVLGTGRCKSCPPSIKYLSLVVVYLAAGILLIIILTKFKLTISNGSLNGLIFYANLMHWNRELFFPQFHNGDIFRLVIAWLNLDLGIEVCFYNGMTALHVIWLQIGYILYILFLQVIIILLCRRYVIFTRFFGRNVTKVLSTLVTLLYAKTLVTVASVFSYTDIHNADVHKHTFKVLSVDGNVRFGSHQHIPLLVVASFLALLVAMFTFSLLFIQILVKVSSWKCFRWVARFQPFFETITGPCNSNYAFWPGYLFFVRSLFMILKFYNDKQTARKALYVPCVCASLTLIFSFLGPMGVYKKWSLNILELSLMVNLALTSLVVGSSLQRKATTTALTKTRISVGIALFTFLACYMQRYIHFKRLKKTFVAFIACIFKHRKLSKWQLPPVVTHTDVTVSNCVSAEQTPLLPAQVMPPVIRYDNLREPLMED